MRSLETSKTPLVGRFFVDPTPKKSNRSLRRGRATTGAIMAAIVFALIIPNVSALDAGPAGLRANIVFSAGSTQEMEIRFPVIADDPDQEAGSYQYNVSVDQGSGFTDLGAVSALKNYAAWGGHQTGTVQFGGATASTIVRVHAYDSGSNTESPVSCTVTVDTANLYEYDSCGSMTTAFTVNPWCADRSPASTDGFDWRHRLSVSFPPNFFVFTAGNDDPGYAAKQVPSDSNNWRFDFKLRASADGGVSTDSILFSFVDTPPSQASTGNGNTNGAFTEGLRLRLVEEGSTWTATVFHHNGGTLDSIIQGTFNTNPNTPTAGYFLMDHNAQVVTASLGSETLTASIPTFIGGNLTNMEGLWLKHSGGVRTQTQYSRVEGETSMCLYTTSEALGGSTATFAEPENQALEDFSGQGGFGGAPQFPGVDVQGTADAWGMDAKFMGYALAAVLIAALAILGFFVGGIVGAVFGTSAGTVATAVLNLVPYWVLILILLLSVTIVVLSFRGGGE